MKKPKSVKPKTETTNESDKLVIQTPAEFKTHIADLVADVKKHSEKNEIKENKMSELEMLTWINKAEKVLPALVDAIKNAKSDMMEEDGKMYKGLLSVVTGKVEKSKIKFTKLRKVIRKQMQRVKNINSITSVVAGYIKESEGK